MNLVDTIAAAMPGILFSFIELTSPAMLAGLALLSLPIIAHLLNRQARRQIIFPTIAFLLASTAAQSQIFQMRRWLLLLLRCLGVAMIAFAFSRPIWKAPYLQGANKKIGRGVVLLLDASVSTRQIADGIGTFQELRAAAVRAVNSLSTGTDLADVVVASLRPRALFDKLSPNVPALRQEVSRLEPTYERADLASAIGLAGRLLATHEGPRSLVILSDLQYSNWKETIAERKSGSVLPPETQVTVFTVAAPAGPNVALAAPRHFPAQPLVEQTTQILVQVANLSRVVQDVRVTPSIDGQAQAARTVTLSPGEQRDVAFDWIFKNSGDHEVVFEIPGDALAADNRAFLALRVRARLPVLIVSDDQPTDPGTASYYLSRALAPQNDARLDRFEVRYVSSAQLPSLKLAEMTMIFVGYLGEMTTQTADTLLAYVRGGGGVVFFCGEGAVRENLLRLRQSAKEVPLLPWEPGLSRTLQDRDKPLTIGGGNWRSRMLRDFDEQSQFVVSQIHFMKGWSTGAVASDTTLLLSFSDGSPALGMHPFGNGQFVLANFSPSLESSDLAKYGAFVALVQGLAQQVSRAANSEAVRPLVGEAYRHADHLPLKSEGFDLTVLDPKHKPIEAVATVHGDQIAVELPKTALPGFYRIRNRETTAAVVAVNVDPRESNLERLDRKSLLQCFERQAANVQVQAANDWSAPSTVDGRPLWGWCLGLALAAFGTEMACLAYWRR